MLVIDKPAGLPVHRGPKGGASLEDEFDALRYGLPRAPALAHRLDRETAGCLVLGRHRKALQKLGNLFKQGRVGKTYWAIVAGGPEADEGFVDKPLGRLDATRGWWMKVDPQGQPAQTRWRIMGRGRLDGSAVAWLEMQPLTGRTHQLRVHAVSRRLADPRRRCVWRRKTPRARCNCSPAASRFRSMPTSRRSWSRRPPLITCWRRWPPAAMSPEASASGQRKPLA